MGAAQACQEFQEKWEEQDVDGDEVSVELVERAVYVYMS